MRRFESRLCRNALHNDLGTDAAGTFGHRVEVKMRRIDELSSPVRKDEPVGFGHDRGVRNGPKLDSFRVAGASLP